MRAVLGIDLLALLGAPVSVTTLPSAGPLRIPPKLTRFLAKLSLLTHETSIADRRVIYTGFIQSGTVQDVAADSDPDDWPLRVPGLFESGLPFRLLIARTPIASGNDIEGNSGEWLLQIFATELSVQLPFKPALYYGETAVAPAYLTADNATAKPTILHVDAGVLEISSNGDVRIRPDFTMSPNPYTGALIRFRFEPKQFYVVDELGVRAGESIIDLSELVSPERATRAGFGPEWKGVAVEELGFYFPRNTPFFVPKSITLKDVLIGDAYAGEGVLELATDPEPPPRPTFFLVVDDRTDQLEVDSDDIIHLPARPEATGLDWRYRIIADASVSPPWTERRAEARWILPNGEVSARPRTEILAVRPGDTLEYYYEATSAAQMSEPPERQVFMFQADGPYPRGTAARLDLLWGVTAATKPELERRRFRDVVHVSATPKFLLDAKFRAFDEADERLEVTVNSSWLIEDEPAVADGEATVDLGRYVIPLMGWDGGMLPGRRLGLRVGLTAEGIRRFALIDVVPNRPDTAFLAVIVCRGSVQGEFVAWRYDGIQRDRQEIPFLGPIQHNYHLQTALGYGRLREMSGQGVPRLDEPHQRDHLLPGRLYEIHVDWAGSAPQPAAPQQRPYRLSFFFPRRQVTEGDVTRAGVSFDDRSEPTGSIMGADAYTMLRRALADLQGGFIYVVGRSSTVGDQTIGQRSPENERLARQRAATGAALATRVVRDLGRTDRIQVQARDEMELPADWVHNPDSRDTHRSPERVGGAVSPSDLSAPTQDQFQRVDLYVVPDPTDPTAQWLPPAASPPTPFSDERRALIPWPRRPTRHVPVRYSISDASLRRLRLTARWDRDPFPVMMEILALMRFGDVSVLSDALERTAAEDEIVSREDLWRFVVRLVRDPHSGRARWTVVVDAAGEESGIYEWRSLPDGLGALAVFGPLLARRVRADAGDAGRWVALSALLGLGVAAEVANVISDVSLILNGVSIDLDTRDVPFDDVEALYLKLDYSVEFHVAIPVLNLQTRADGPVRIRYRNVGAAFMDPIRDSYFLFDEEHGGNVALEDAGVFEQGSGSAGASLFGDLVQVVGSRLGQGSMFLELDLAFVLDVGIIEIKRTTVRLVMQDDGTVGFEVRGLGVALRVPGTLTGEGTLDLREDGFRVQLDVVVEPVQLHSAGSLELYDQADFSAVAVGLATDYPVGMPLAATGLGIYGFFGHFAANMTRAVPMLADPIAAELAWLGRLLGASSARPSGGESPWRVERESWAFGIGAVVGTLPDAARSFHAKGALVLEIPGPTIVFGIDVEFLKTRREVRGAADVSSSSTLRGIISLTPAAFMLGIDVDLNLENLLRVQIPIRALYPRPTSGGRRDTAYLRIGSDGIDPGDGTPARVGGPITIELNIAGLIGLDAFAYLMIEESSLHKLGGHERLNFDGFSVGFGLGISLFIGSRDVGIYLEASALVLAGLGTSPLVIGGLIEIRGTLKILIIAISVSAHLEFVHREPGPALPPEAGAEGPARTGTQTTFDGEFCGSIDFFFFTLRACVRFSIGHGDAYAVPQPPPLITGISFMDRRGFEVTKLELDDDGRLVGDAVVWPDTVPVLHFRTEPSLALAPESPFVRLTSLDHPTEVTIGRLKYRFTLMDLQLDREVDGEWQPHRGSLDAAWWLPSERPAFLSQDEIVQPADASGFGEESRALGLLTWEPAPWMRALALDGQGPALDNVEQGLGSLCGAHKTLPRDCALFAAARRDPAAEAWLVAGEHGRADVTARAIGDARGSLEENVAVLTALGPVEYVPMEGTVWRPTISALDRDYAGALRVAQVVVHDAEDMQRGDVVRTLVTTTTILELRRRQYDGSLLLAVSIADLSQPYRGIELPREADEHGAAIALQSMTVAVRGEGAGWHLVPGTVVMDDVQLTPKDHYRLIEFRTRDGALGRGGFFDAWSIPATRGDVQVVSACGEDEGARRQAEAANDRRSAARDRFREIANRPAGTPSQFILDADAHYRVRASWSWEGVHEHEPEHRVGAGPLAQHFEFRTAKRSTAEPAPPRDPGGATNIDQRTFDVRDLRHYVKEHPRFQDPPWFLDDPLSVTFRIDYLETLLERYQRDLMLTVERTDAPMPADGPSLIHGIDWQPAFADPAEAAVRGFMAAQRCLPPNLPGTGRQGLIDVQLEPLGRYDLSIRASRRNGVVAEDADLVFRAPFLASRYRTPGELLAASGFGSDEHPSFRLPTDVIVGTAAPGWETLGAREASDVDFEEALAAYGLADYDAPDAPRTTVFWQRAPLPPTGLRPGAIGPPSIGGPFSIGGRPMPRLPQPSLAPASARWCVLAVLVESDEPILRSDVLTVIAVTVQPLGRPLAYTRANSNGTRVLFEASAPIELPSDRELAIELRYEHRRLAVQDGRVEPSPRTATSRHALQPIPDIVRWAV